MFLVFPRFLSMSFVFFPMCSTICFDFPCFVSPFIRFPQFFPCFSHVFPSFLAVLLVFPTFFLCVESPFRFRAEAYELAVLNNRDRSHFEAIECLCLGLIRCNGYNGG
jgi:hypothetical protein